MAEEVVPMDWARQQFGSACLGDKRRTARAVELGASLLNGSDRSLPEQTGNWNALRAAYRLLAEPDVTHELLSTPHWGLTRAEASKPDLGAVLLVQDGTELDYTSHPQTSGLGFIGNGSGRGMELHTTLCVLPGPEAQVVGMAHSRAWVRGDKPKKGTETRAQRNARHKETDVWGDCAEAIGPAPDPAIGTRWVSVSDRGSDVFSFLSRAMALGWKCLVRSKHDRRMTDLDGEEDRLHEFARLLPSQSCIALDLRARAGQPARKVNLHLAWSPVTLQPPSDTPGTPIEAWCIRAWELAEDGLEWILVSTDPVLTLSDVHEKLEWYRCRWLVEEYHKCLKTGCNIERRQVTTHQSLQALLGFLGVVAVFLLQLKTTCKPATIPEQLKLALQALSKRKQEDPDMQTLWRQIAMLGGFLGRKSDGQPGWQTIWRGWNRLQDIALGVELGLKLAQS